VVGAENLPVAANGDCADKEVYRRSGYPSGSALVVQVSGLFVIRHFYGNLFKGWDTSF
jgi:hypothetical protein